MAFCDPHIRLLQECKLIGSNYESWRKRLDIVLRAEGYKYVLETSCPVMEDYSSHSFDAMVKWQKDNVTAKCHMLASMSGELQYIHHGMVTAKEILDSLHEMFGSNGPRRNINHEVVILSKLDKGISVHNLYTREMKSLWQSNSRIKAIREGLASARKTVESFHPEWELDQVLSSDSDSLRRLSKKKGKKKMNIEKTLSQKEKKTEKLSRDDFLKISNFKERSSSLVIGQRGEGKGK